MSKSKKTTSAHKNKKIRQAVVGRLIEGKFGFSPFDAVKGSGVRIGNGGAYEVIGTWCLQQFSHRPGQSAIHNMLQEARERMLLHTDGKVKPFVRPPQSKTDPERETVDRKIRELQGQLVAAHAASDVLHQQIAAMTVQMTDLANIVSKKA